MFWLFMTCMDAHCPTVELVNAVWFSTFYSMSGFLRHSLKWNPPLVQLFPSIYVLYFLQYHTDEYSVLELGLSFCPTTKYLNKEQTTCNFYNFIRCLKFFEYFHENPNLHDSQHTNNDVDTERDILDWIKRNPDWYPNYVKEK